MICQSYFNKTGEKGKYGVKSIKRQIKKVQTKAFKKTVL